MNQTENKRLAATDTANFRSVADIFKQMGDPTRIRIFLILCHYRQCVSDIADAIDMSSPAVSHHLRVLKNCGLIESVRLGKEVYYSASNDKLPQLIHVVIEQVMKMSCPDFDHLESTSGSLTVDIPEEQLAIAKQVHSYVLENIDKRITIEDLSKIFLINPTSLKSVFKSLYGDSIASHIREHRMAKAGRLLKSGDFSLAEIASQVGYESQSKFSAAFKKHFGVLPRDYRKS